MTPNTEISLPQSSFPYPNSISNHLPLNWLSLTSLSLSHIHSLIFPNFLGSKPRVLQDKADKGFGPVGERPTLPGETPSIISSVSRSHPSIPTAFSQGPLCETDLGFYADHHGDGPPRRRGKDLLLFWPAFLKRNVPLVQNNHDWFRWRADQKQDGIECTEFSESNREGGQWSITGIGERESREGNNTSIRSPWNYAGKKESDIQNQFESTTLLFLKNPKIDSNRASHFGRVTKGGNSLQGNKTNNQEAAPKKAPRGSHRLSNKIITSSFK